MSESNYTPEEQAEHRAKLTSALRSGAYAQTRGVLRDGFDDDSAPRPRGGFCCLGVACDISGLGTWDASGTYYDDADDRTSDTHLTPAVKDWLDYD